MKDRIAEHKKGKTFAGSRFKLVYHEVCLSKKDALEREKQLKPVLVEDICAEG